MTLIESYYEGSLVRNHEDTKSLRHEEKKKL